MVFNELRFAFAICAHNGLQNGCFRPVVANSATTTEKKRRPYYESLTHANRHRRGDIHKILCSQQAVVAADQTLGQPIHQLTSG